MKVSSYFRLGIVLVIVAVIQGWLLMRIFVAPRVYTSAEPYIVGSTVDVRAPISGTLDSVTVHDGEHVDEGQTLFTVRRTVVDPETQRLRDESIVINAQLTGEIGDVSTVRGTFVQADQKLASIVDNSPDMLYVTARMSVTPRDVARIHRLMSATVTADFLSDGKPIDAMISSVNPLYDPQSKTLNVKLQLLRYPDELEGLPLGLPVQVQIFDNRSSDDNAVIAILHWMFPQSEAETRK